VLDEERSIQNKIGLMRRISCSHFGCCCLHKKGENQLRQKNTRSSQTSCKVHWSWRWGFSNIYYELLTNRSFKHEITIKFDLTKSNLSFFIAVHNVFVFVDSNSSISVTIQNSTHVHTNFFSHNNRYHLQKYWPFLLNHPV